MEKLYIISNESIFEENGNFFCDNIDIKSTPEGLDKKFEVHLFGRNSKKQRAHKINLKNIIISKNFFLYLFKILKSLQKKNSKYLIISISPYTFFAIVFLRMLNKKTLVYLRSDGYGEYKAIYGLIGFLIYDLMFSIVSSISSLISCRKYILKGKMGNVVLPSQLNSGWLSNLAEPNLGQIKLLYVGRLRKEKGIFSLLELIKNIDLDLNLTIVGAEIDFDSSNYDKNINFLKIESNEEKLKKVYDENNIFILPSYTEGHPMVILEALARNRPVIIFEEIKHIIGQKKGIFICERNTDSLKDAILYIKKNYSNIQQELKSNKLPTKDQFISNLANLIRDHKG